MHACMQASRQGQAGRQAGRTKLETYMYSTTVNDESLEWLKFGEFVFEESWLKKVW